MSVGYSIYTHQLCRAFDDSAEPAFLSLIFRTQHIVCISILSALLRDTKLIHLMCTEATYEKSVCPFGAEC